MLFHIGYHKTGTTFLQQALFEASGIFHRVPQREIFWKFIYPHTLEFENGQVREFVAGHLRFAEARALSVVFSNERLSGGIHTGGHDSVELAGRIEACVPDARILLFVREQRSLLLSLYAQYVRGVGCVSLREYCDPRYTTHTKELFNPVTLEFDRLVAEYTRRFDRVLVLPFEWLKEDPDGVVAKILAHAGVPESRRRGVSLRTEKPRNVSRSAVLQRVDRVLHPLRSGNIPHVGSTFCNPVGRAVAGVASRGTALLPLGWLEEGLRRRDRAYIEGFCGERYSESNARLGEMIGIDLLELGYS